MSFELRLQMILRRGIHREYDQSGRIAIDAVDDERPAAAARPQVSLQVVEYRASALSPLERQRDGEDTSCLVQHDQLIVLEHNRQIAGSAERAAALGAARPID